MLIKRRADGTGYVLALSVRRKIRVLRHSGQGICYGTELHTRGHVHKYTGCCNGVTVSIPKYPSADKQHHRLSSSGPSRNTHEMTQVTYSNICVY